MNMGNKHLIKCWIWKAMWVLAVLSFVLAWVSVMRRAPIGQFDPLFLLWNALVLGVLSIPVKLDCRKCGTCNVSDHSDHSHASGGTM